MLPVTSLLVAVWLLAESEFSLALGSVRNSYTSVCVCVGVCGRIPTASAGMLTSWLRFILQ